MGMRIRVLDVRSWEHPIPTFRQLLVSMSPASSEHPDHPVWPRLLLAAQTTRHAPSHEISTARMVSRRQVSRWCRLCSAYQSEFPSDGMLSNLSALSRMSGVEWLLASF